MNAINMLFENYDYKDFEDIIPFLQTMAEKDPKFRYKKDKNGKVIGKKYYYREEATKLLKKLNTKKKLEEKQNKRKRKNNK